jgi:hypothetical protein
MVYKVASGYVADSFMPTLSRAAGGRQIARIALKAMSEVAFLMEGEEYPTC